MKKKYGLAVVMVLIIMAIGCGNNEDEYEYGPDEPIPYEIREQEIEKEMEQIRTIESDEIERVRLTDYEQNLDYNLDFRDSFITKCDEEIEYYLADSEKMIELQNCVAEFNRTVFNNDYSISRSEGYGSFRYTLSVKESTAYPTRDTYFSKDGMEGSYPGGWDELLSLIEETIDESQQVELDFETEEWLPLEEYYKKYPERKKDFIEGIESCPEIEEMVPGRFHETVNEIIVDYDTLSDEEMWTKYNLSEIWFTTEEYASEKEERELCGFIIVNYLVDKGYILQLDYKEDVANYIDGIESFWDEENLKIVSFDLDNDQFYLAKIPSEVSLQNIFEVEVSEYSW